MRIKQQWGIALLVFVMLVYFSFYFFAFGNKTESIKEIYFADRITAAHKVLIDKYNRLNEGKLKIVPIDFPHFDFSTNERKELLARSLRGRGNGIDLFAVDVIWVQRFAKWCEPLDKYFSEEETDRILDNALKSCYFENSLVAVPLDQVQGILYYREDLINKLDKSGKLVDKLKEDITWEEFVDIKNQINYDAPFYVFPAADYEGLICCFYELLLGLNPDYCEQYGFNLKTAEAEKSLRLLVDLVHKYKLSPPVISEFSEAPSYEYFVNNDALFIRGWHSFAKDFLERPINREKQRHLRKAPVPYFKDGKPSSVFGGWDLMVSKFSDKKKEAVDFIKFLLSEKSQEVLYKDAAYLPVIKSFYEDEELTKRYPEMSDYKKIIKTGVHRPAHVEYTRYSEIMSHYFEMAIKKEISVEEALEKATNSIKEESILLKNLCN
ncbi:MAG: extracellular solute-binding protein [Ignavibacteria bacterium]|jgi:multiple sugar transport system substrate-binding protein